MPLTLYLSRNKFCNPSWDDGTTRVAYLRCGATFADGIHFSGAFLSCYENAVSQHGCYTYDGLAGHNLVGCQPPSNPLGSSLSYLIYALLPDKYCKEVTKFVQFVNPS